MLNVAIDAVRESGFAATSVEDLCRRAGVTKGAFFHHFPTKEALGIAAAEHWSATTGDLFETAPYHAPADPLDRVLAYLDFRKAIVEGDIAGFTCYLGTTVQEAYAAPALRDACRAGISGHAETLEEDIAAAIALYPPSSPVTPSGLALHFQAVIQGAFVMAKAWNDPATARDSLDHLIAYVRLLFPAPTERSRPCPK
ncbi:TetR/AcrR family transcriptional regulator [Pseudooceanicola sp.]|uniref:TetR/AcrR family transcriptional regulator n=1 Tax=Pseudooceanicola sp. TaxID=1914328 RepID=UPI0035C6ED28